jgi:sporulation protein YlmC with PRC-barrel domain
MAASNTATLHSLRDTDLALANTAADVRGRKVLDSNGEDLGTVDDLLVDDDENRVRFLRIEFGGFLGLGATQFLVPVDAVTRVDDKYVHIDRSRDKIADAPRYDPEVVDQDYFNRVYGYYGHQPYWTAGYIYPTYY